MPSRGTYRGGESGFGGKRPLGPTVNFEDSGAPGATRGRSLAAYRAAIVLGPTAGMEYSLASASSAAAMEGPPIDFFHLFYQFLVLSFLQIFIISQKLFLKKNARRANSF